MCTRHCDTVLSWMMLIFTGNENQDSSFFFHNPADKQAELKTQPPWLYNRLISNILQTHIILPTKQNHQTNLQ